MRCCQMKAFNAWPFALIAAATFAGSMFCTATAVDRENDEPAIAGGTDRSSLSDRAQTVKSSPPTKIVVSIRPDTIRNLFIESCIWFSSFAHRDTKKLRGYDFHRSVNLMLDLGGEVTVSSDSLVGSER